METLVALRADVHTKLEKMLKDRADTALAEQIVQKLNEQNPCDVPPTLVEQQCRIMEQEVVQSARRTSGPSESGSSPAVETTATERTVSSPRTFRGQSCTKSASARSGVSLRPRPSQRASKWLVSAGMSSRRSRSGGKRMVHCASRE